MGLYYIVRLKKDHIYSRLHSYLLFSLSAISFVSLIVSDSEDNVLFLIVSIVLLRTVCVTGWLTQWYLHFFNENPYTYYSHIGVVNALTNDYPYDGPLGMAVAYNNQNANATFFLTEGIASWGAVGVFITGIIFLIFLYFINSFSYRYKNTDLFVVFIPSLVSLLNGSFFASLLTGGLFILVFLIATFKPETQNNQITNTLSE